MLSEKCHEVLEYMMASCCAELGWTNSSSNGT